MENQPSVALEETSPHVAVFRMASSIVLARGLYAIAELRVADFLGADEIHSVEELAESSGAAADPLYRVMRMLATKGIFRELEPRRFQHTAMSLTLRADHPSRARAAVMLASGPLWWRGLDHLSHTLRTGETSFDVSVGRGFFDYLWDHPEHADNFGEAMVSVHAAEPAALTQAYDFSSFSRIIDVGGGTGNLITHILKTFAGVSGVLYETAHVAKAARERIEKEGLTDRCGVIEGSFFESIPEGGDLYLLSHVIHDWDEERCSTILSKCRGAMGRGARLLIVEMVVPPPGQAHPSKMVDVQMLAFTGGRERTEGEYESLLASSGLRMARVIPTQSRVSIIEVERDDEPGEREQIEDVPPVPWV